MIIALAALTLTIAAAGAWQWAPAAEGTLRVSSDPPGADVRIDDQVQGLTPLELTLPAGAHTLEVGQDSAVRQLRIDITGGGGHTLHVALAPEAEAVSTGSLTVTSDTAGHAVSVGGVQLGTTPLTLHGLAAGQHEVVVDMGATVTRRQVDVGSGTTATLHVAERPTPRWGWLTLSAPFPMLVLEDGRVIGSSDLDQLRLPSGDYQLELVAAPFGFRQAVQVRIMAGRPSVVTPEIPQAALDLSAFPSAQVTIDGVVVGDTPLPNVSVPIGDHVVVFRHPVLGERRQVVRVTLQEPTALSVDMTTR